MISSVHVIHAGFLVAMVRLVTIVTGSHLNKINLEMNTVENH